MANKKRSDGRRKKCFTYNGKKYYVYGRTQRELEDNIQKKKEQLAKGIEKRKNPTVAEYYEQWSDNRLSSVSEQTYRCQQQIFKAISRVELSGMGLKFGEMKIGDITIEDLREVRNTLLETRTTRTVNDYMSHLKHVFTDALKERIIEYNPCVLVKSLKRTEEQARDTIHRALTPEETKIFFECDRAKQSFYYNVFRFAVHTGMRVGEIGALRYSDIKDGFIHVERTITRAQTGGYFIGDSAKTKAGVRTIPLTEEMKAIIDEQKKINAMLDGNVISINDTIFKATERGLLLATPIDREIKKACVAAGIEPFTMHGFRATFATRCVESGMQPKTLQEIMGHANIGITLNLYSHCMEETKTDQMKNVSIVI